MWGGGKSSCKNSLGPGYGKSWILGKESNQIPLKNEFLTFIFFKKKKKRRGVKWLEQHFKTFIMTE